MPIGTSKSDGDGITTSVMSSHDDIIVYVVQEFKNKMAAAGCTDDRQRRFWQSELEGD